MLAFPLDQKNSPHPTVYLTLDSPFNSCQQAMPNLGVFPVPEKEDPFFPLTIPRRKNVKPHFTKRIGMLVKVTQQASRIGPDIQFYCSLAPSCSQHSFIQRLSASTLQGAGDTDEKKTTCLKGAYLPVRVCALKKKEQSKQVTHVSGTWDLDDRSLLTFPATSLPLPQMPALCTVWASCSLHVQHLLAHWKPLLSCQSVHSACGQPLKYLWKGAPSLCPLLASIDQGKESFQNSEP